jgi:hypothetical protein
VYPNVFSDDNARRAVLATIQRAEPTWSNLTAATWSIATSGRLYNSIHRFISAGVIQPVFPLCQKWFAMPHDDDLFH